jgi:hypothetical protein
MGILGLLMVGKIPLETLMGGSDSSGESSGCDVGGDSSGFTGGVIVDPEDDFFDYYFKRR